MLNERVIEQFSLRAATYNKSAAWIMDSSLVQKHLDLVKVKSGRCLELCSGTGVIGNSFSLSGWNVTCLDLTFEMVREMKNSEISRVQGNSEELPFRDESFDLIVLRQALFLIDSLKMLKEVRRILKTKGSFILSQSVPFSSEDEEWLKKIHFAKQAQLKKFYTEVDLKKELESNQFKITAINNTVVRESINIWLDNAPELSPEKKKEVQGLIENSPENYRKLRKVELKNGELFENWYWVIFKAQK